MSVLNKLASALGRNDEVPNQTLAKEIAEAGDTNAVRELVANLTHKDKVVQSDCIKVLYEVGALKPVLIADYVDEFVRVLRGRNNRLIWGAMTALGAIADQRAADIWSHIDVIIEATEHGSVITQDWGIRVLAAVSAKNPTYEKRIFPFLSSFLQKCRPKDLPRHAASVMIAVNAGNRAELGTILEARRGVLKPAQALRLDQVIRKLKR